MLRKELEAAVMLARTASDAVLDHYSREIFAEQKLGVDEYFEPVTAADKEASRIIVEGLSAAFPDDAVLSEEEVDNAEKRLSRKRVWIVDPIDGTAGFVKKDGDFAVQIGLAENGEAVLGVVLLPIHRTVYYAVKGEGAFAEVDDSKKRLQASDLTLFEEMTLAFSRNHPSKGITAIISDFRFGNAVQRGSIGLKVGLIAEQQADLYIHLSPRTKLWDTCAPQVILEEAGGRLTDLFGDAYRYDVSDVQNHGGIVATNGISHDAVIEKLRPILNEIGRLKTRSKALN
ncbi:MAG TPA: 3'(2'),5'-bisphosphate nucleotidase CysQ [Pyrinomonadaceae bacterium]|nr:3'(2'),5'-bisphosphate nucleotidase CysQ [Pyrinomonadaceae bacterium]